MTNFNPLIIKAGTIRQIDTAVDKLLVNTMLVLTGTVDPSAGAGIIAAQPALFFRTNAGVSTLYLKTGAADTAWTRMDTFGSTSAILGFGANSINAAADTRYLPFGRETATAGTTQIYGLRAPRAGTMRNLYVHHNSLVGNGNAIVYALVVNGVASTLTASLASTAADVSDTTHSVTIAANDLINVTATKALGIGSGGVDVMVSLEFV